MHAHIVVQTTLNNSNHMS